MLKLNTTCSTATTTTNLEIEKEVHKKKKKLGTEYVVDSVSHRGEHMIVAVWRYLKK